MCHLTSRPKVMRICNAYWTQSARRIYAICEIDDTVFTQRWVLEVAFIIILNDGKIKRDWQIYKCSQIVEMDAVSWDHFPRGPTRSPWCRVSGSPDQQLLSHTLFIVIHNTHCLLSAVSKLQHNLCTGRDVMWSMFVVWWLCDLHFIITQDLAVVLISGLASLSTED